MDYGRQRQDVQSPTEAGSEAVQLSLDRSQTPYVDCRACARGGGYDLHEVCCPCP